ncbi:glycosyltransferase family 2 protein [Paenibacillus ginsengihumi]|uniref:glycosyltransferase family 2 protein n=1 Tax=Paenibacillus ginsengihumi TaxID=431596 RepID=UPI000369B70D|nr:glycosyltransferase [Paenibacillus ginsengihumi]
MNLTMREYPDLSIIIATYQRVEALVDSLSRMKNRNVFAGISTELIIVFDGSIPDEESTIKEINENTPSNKTTVVSSGTDRKGQNYARNLGVDKSNASVLLFIDDDAHIEDATQISEALDLLRSNENIGVLGLESIVYQTGEDQYYGAYLGEKDYFPVTIACLAGCLVHKDRVLKERQGRLFFPESIAYGSDEWALALKSRHYGYQVCATRKAQVIHRFVDSGRDPDYRGRLQYGHSFIWSMFPLSIGLLFLFGRIINIWMRRRDGFLKEKIKYMFKGFFEGRKTKWELQLEGFGRSVISRRKSYQLLSEALEAGGKDVSAAIVKVCSWFLR